MPTILVLTFPWGRYHATPWGTQVNQGAVELPPSPWRLLRALYAVWRTRVPDLPEELVHDLLDRLAVPPTFAVPEHTIAHTRHYYPDTGRSKDKTLDAFAVFRREDELAIMWPGDLPSEHRQALEKLTAAIPYFGRADSPCEAQVVLHWLPSAHSVWVPVDAAEEVSPRAEVTAVLAADRPLRITSLVASPADVRRAGLPFPDGSRLVGYLRTPSPVRPPVQRARPTHRSITAVRFDVAQSGVPPATEAVVYTDLLRQAALSKLNRPPGERERTLLGGKAPDGSALADHCHAHYLPLVRDARLAGFVVWTPGILPEEEFAALTAVRKLWHRLNENWRLIVRVSGVGRTEQVAPELTGPARSWRSITPYTPSRYAKRKEDWAEFLSKDIAKELEYRKFPHAEVSPMDGDWVAYRRYRPSARQRHDSHQGRANRPSAFVRLEFDEPVSGPIVLGHLSHFGLGLFVPDN